MEYSTATPALSDAVHTPKETQMMMNSGMMRAGMPESRLLAARLPSNLIFSGCQPFLALMMYTSTSWVRPIRMPGTAPATNSAPTDAPTIMGVEGGMIMPMVEDATVIPAEASGG